MSGGAKALNQKGEPEIKIEIESEGNYSMENESSGETSPQIKQIVKCGGIEGKKHQDEVIENNTDSNKSHNMFQTPSNVHSSNVSLNKMDIDYMTPKSRHNLNLLFTESNGKKSTTQRKMINNLNIDSPFEHRGFIHYPYNLAVSPIDPMKLSSKSKSIHNMLTSNTLGSSNYAHTPQYVFNNNEGIMSINIQHKHIYGKPIKADTNKKFNRKIEFKSNLTSSGESNEEVPSISCESESSSEKEEVIKKPQPILLPTSLPNSIHKPGEPIYLLPGYTQMPFNSNLYSYSRMSSQEIQQKETEELANKKNFCKCKRSKCLKLYCECFANGEMCVNCNCLDCSNVVGNEVEKHEAFKSIKDRNPVAMKLNNIKEQKETGEAKIGCNCTKSNCSKKYCECYKVGVECTDACRCRDCSNASHRKKSACRENLLTEGSAYSYHNFIMERISVLIENKKIKVVEMILEDKKGNYNENCLVKKINNQLFIELSKKSLGNVLDKPHIHSSTPVVNKNKKRKRYQSFDSKDSFDKSEYNHKLTKTACDTNKKTNWGKNNVMQNMIGKKLNLDDLNNCSNNLLG